MAGVLHPDVDPAGAIAVGREVGRRASASAVQHDRDGSFVHEGYEAIRETRYGSLGVPSELGGGGHGLMGICRAQAAIGRYCASTSLAIAMHQHAVLSMAWRWHQGDEEVERILCRVVDEGMILSVSGALNPAAISVEAVPCDGGYVVSGQRRLCSGAPGADGLMTPANLVTGSEKRLISIVVPFGAGGVEVIDDWDSMGMRGSGSNGVRLSDVFVPSENALYVDGPPDLRRNLQRQPGPVGPGEQHAGPPGIMMPGLHISLAVIAACYLGAATGAKDAAIAEVAGKPRADNFTTKRLVGLLVHEVRSGWWALEGMIRQTTDESLGTREQMVTTMLGKRQIVLSSIHAAELTMEILGSKSYMRNEIFERTLRDVRAGLTHPLPPDQTLLEVGRSALMEAGS